VLSARQPSKCISKLYVVGGVGVTNVEDRSAKRPHTRPPFPPPLLALTLVSKSQAYDVSVNEKANEPKFTHSCALCGSWLD